MKTKTYRGILLAAMLFFTPGLACSITSSSAPSSQSSTISGDAIPARNSQVLGDLGSIAYTLDTARKMSGTFDINTGEPLTLMVEDANGYGWMLSIPADALLSTQTITMTPFATIDVSRSGAKIRSGIQLEPDGLQFADAVRLTVKPPISNPGVGLIFSIQKDGSDVAFAPTTNSREIAMAQIWHFSSAGYDDGYDAGKDGMAQYKKWAEEDYQLALDAAKQFVKKGAPTPPTPPSISMFCRGTEVNPEEGEAYEFTHYFVEPYGDIVNVILSTMKTLELLSEANFDTSDGYYWAQQVLQMAEKSIMQLGKQYQGEKPPDRLFAVLSAGLEVEHQLKLVNGEMGINPTLISWGETIRNYYLEELKIKHDYRAFPIIMSLNKQVILIGGADRLADILSAMTFEVILDTSFDGTWISSGKTILIGHVEQNADVKDIKTFLTTEELWGDLNNLILKVKTGTYTDYKGTTQLDGLSDTGTLWLKNWDACVTKTFDVMLGGFSGDGNSKSGTIAGAASMASFTKYYWKVAGAFMFTIPMENLNQTLGDQSFSGSGSAAEGNFTSSGQIHIVIKHTPT
jgi:hypothetical protein